VFSYNACFVYCERARNELNATKQWLNRERESNPIARDTNEQTNGITMTVTKHSRRVEQRSDVAVFFLETSKLQDLVLRH
jgi:hypothetical protein